MLLATTPSVLRWPLPRIVLGLLTGTVAIAALLTGSRAAILGLFAAAVMIAFHGTQRARTRKALAVVALVGVLVMSFSTELRSRIIETDVAEHNVSVRLDLWEETPRLAMQSPLLGIGYSRWNDVIIREGATMSLRSEIPGIVSTGAGLPVRSVDDTAHNSYLMIAAEQGVVGLGLSLFLWFALFRRVRLGAQRTDGVIAPPLSVIATGLIAFLAAVSLVGHAMSSPTTVTAVAIPLGLALSIPSRSGNDRDLYSGAGVSDVYAETRTSGFR